MIEKLMKRILDEGYVYKDKSRDVNCIQLSHATLEYDLSEGKIPIMTTKHVSLHNIVGELIWFLRGDTNIKYLVDNNIHIWDKDAYNQYARKMKNKPNGYMSFECFQIVMNSERNDIDLTTETGESFKLGNLGNLGRVYGAQWRKWHENFIPAHDAYEGEWKTVDQISNLIHNLKTNPMSRRHIVTAWNPAELNDMALPPCHWSFEIIPQPLNDTEEDWRGNLGNVISDCNHRCSGKLYHYKKEPESTHCQECENNIPKYGFTLKWHQRSVDTFLGLPYNVTSYAILANIIGMLTNMRPLTLIADLSNVHIYEPHVPAVREVLSREPYDYPELLIEDTLVYNVDLFNTENNFSKFADRLSISNFKLKDYKFHPPIKAEMFAPLNNN